MALSSERRFSFKVPTEGEFGLKSYKRLWSDGAGSRVERLLLPLKIGAWSAAKAGCRACLTKQVPRGSVAPQGAYSSTGLSGKGRPRGRVAGCWMEEAAPLPGVLLNRRGSAGPAAPCLRLPPCTTEFLSWAFSFASNPQPPPPCVHVTPPGIAQGRQRCPQRVPGAQDRSSPPSFLLPLELLLTPLSGCLPPGLADRDS